MFPFAGIETGLSGKSPVCIRNCFSSAYFPALRVATSKITAPTSTSARTIYWIEMSQPNRFIPFVREAITRAPENRPGHLAGTAGYGYTTDKCRSDGIEFHPWAGNRRCRPQPGGIHDTGQGGQQAHRAKNQIGDFLYTDAVQLSCLWITAHGINMPPDDGPGGDVGVNKTTTIRITAAQERPWYPASTQVMRANHDRNECQLQDVQVHWYYCKVVRLGLFAVADIACNIQNDRQ